MSAPVSSGTCSVASKPSARSSHDTAAGASGYCSSGQIAGAVAVAPVSYVSKRPQMPARIAQREIARAVAHVLERAHDLGASRNCAIVNGIGIGHANVKPLPDVRPRAVRRGRQRRADADAVRSEQEIRVRHRAVGRPMVGADREAERPHQPLDRSWRIGVTKDRREIEGGSRHVPRVAAGAAVRLG